MVAGPEGLATDYEIVFKAKEANTNTDAMNRLLMHNFNSLKKLESCIE